MNIRRMDNLGRIVLPKDIRRALGIRNGTPMEICVTSEGILLKKYHPELELSDMVKNFMEAVEDRCDDLGLEKTGDIQRHILEIQKLLK